jgi:hypothetical protein
VHEDDGGRVGWPGDQAVGRDPGGVHDELLDPPQLHLRYEVTYLRDEDPEPLLSDPTLAPLAVLARAHDRNERTHTLRRALTVIATVEDPSHRNDLVHTAGTLAAIHLDAATIEELTTEAGMPFILDEDTVGGRSIAVAAEARGEARGEARQRARTLARLMRRTFGDDPRIPALAERLAQLPEEPTLDATLSATTLDDLVTLAASSDARAGQQ